MAIKILKPTVITDNFQLPNGVKYTEYTRSLEVVVFGLLSALKLAGNTAVSRQDICDILGTMPGLKFKSYGQNAEMRFVTEAILRWVALYGGTYTGQQSKQAVLTF